MRTEPKKNPGRRRGALGAAAMVLLLGAFAGADTFTVVNTNDSGAGSLRQAIADANAHPGLDTVAFNIPGGGVHTIDVSGSFGTISSPVIIDGATQPGYAGAPLIELHSTILDNGFWINAGSSTIRALVFNGFGMAMGFQNAGGNKVEGCYIGTNADGTASASTAQQGIRMINSDDNVIGGSSASARNLFSGNYIGIGVESSDGVVIQGNLFGTDVTGTQSIPNNTAISLAAANDATIGGSAPGEGNVISSSNGSGIGMNSGNNIVIRGNFIGTDITGTRAFGNGMGINESGNDNVAIGGTGPGDGNLISGNNGYGIYAYNSANHTTVLGNKIGTDVTGTKPLGNLTGIATSNDTGGLRVGGTAPGEANIIAFNSGYLAFSAPVGALVYSSSKQVPIRGNSIHDNEQLGIAFTGELPTYNDPGDVDTGANEQQNFPIVRSVEYGNSSTRVVAKLNSVASTTYVLDFYANPPCLRFPRDFIEGETYLGASEVTTDAAGHADVDVTLPVAVENGARIAVTATDPLGNTSEFSQRIIFRMTPASGPADGGRPVQVFGTDFAPGLTLKIGGVEIPYDYQNDHLLYSSSPLLAPGKVNDVVVTTPDGTTGTLVNGWVSDFLDVPETQQFHTYVTQLVSNAITVGVGGGMYGVNQPTLRQQMAALVLKALYGLCYVPPPCTGQFDDVPCPSTFAAWIEAFANEGITGGCGNGNTYCPQNPVRRDQMAVFLLKAEHGADYAPPACTGLYSDVPCPSFFANWIEQLATEQITSGCGGGKYCPTDSITRGQMAVFLVKTFKLP
jgi:hypothetical protein